MKIYNYWKLYHSFITAFRESKNPNRLDVETYCNKYLNVRNTKQCVLILRTDDMEVIIVRSICMY